MNYSDDDNLSKKLARIDEYISKLEILVSTYKFNFARFKKAMLKKKGGKNGDEVELYRNRIIICGNERRRVIMDMNEYIDYINDYYGKEIITKMIVL